MDLPSLEERYDLGEELGRGGLGVVRVARDRSSGARRAAKIALPGAAAASDERVLREARLLRGLDHPRVARLIEVVRDREGALVLVYELVPGEDLAEVLARRRPAPPEVSAWVADVAEGLEALHGAGLVHRDLKPGNLMLEPSGRIRVLDFGLARPEVAGETLTESGVVMGTLATMAPEQLRGERATPAADVYALGCVAHELLTGAPPFRGELAEMIRQHMEADPPGVPGRAGVSRVIHGALAKEPATRPSARRFADALADALDAEGRAELEDTALAPDEGGPGPVAVEPEPEPPRTLPAGVLPPPPAPASARTVPGVALVLLAGAGLGALALVGRPPASAPRPGKAAVRPSLLLIAGLRQAGRAAQGDPAIRRAVSLAEGAGSTQARTTWEAGRAAWRRHGAALRPLLRDLHDAPWDREVHEEVAELALHQALLTRSGWEDVGPLFPPGEAPELEPYLARVFRVEREPRVPSRWEGTQEEQAAGIRALLRRSAPGWRLLSGLASLPRLTRRRAPGGTYPNSRIRPRNLAGILFETPYGFRSAADELTRVLRAEFYESREAPEDSPSERVVALPRPAGEELALLVTTWSWPANIQVLATFEGEGPPLRCPFTIPFPPGEPQRAGDRVAATAFRVATAALPRGLARVRFEARGLQPVGSPFTFVNLMEVFTAEVPGP